MSYNNDGFKKISDSLIKELEKYSFNEELNFMGLSKQLEEVSNNIFINTMDNEYLNRYMEQYYPVTIDIIINNIISCECGSDKCGGGSHSNWCPKFKE